MIFLNNLLIYIITFSALFQLLVEVKPQIVTDKPDLRYAHTATLIDDKIYMLGGGIPPRTNSIPPKETFLCLDVSTPFNTSEVNYIDILNNIVPPHRYAIAIKGGANNSTLFLYGGEVIGNQTMALVYTYDAQHDTWSVPNIIGTPPVGREFMFPVINYNGLFYMFGGSAGGVFVSDMFILDTIHFNWYKASSTFAPSNRDGYGAVFLPNKNIIYIGGFNGQSGWLPMNQVFLYDTTKDLWESKSTDGRVPSARAAFSAVLGLDAQRVIIFGGDTSATSNNFLSPEDALYFLDLNNFTWDIPKISGKIPSSRTFHRSLVIGKYMVVTFGAGYTRDEDNDILLLDISNNDEYVWTTSFVPQSLTSQPQSPIPQPSSQSITNTNTNSIGIAIGVSIGIIGGIALTVGSFFLYKQYKNRKEQRIAIPTPGNEGIRKERV
ncbi:hypothetical protein RclHR1_00370013 [Rhizophagus clarus]|uniref:Galactose oxidase n=1 Tax=Rhizophagus clarus TaxID=94130 RepID=A0A2Z6RG19_9GLOM|nr:hypothetical protein RclHR1_00370013 [Rhizophagus clarus]